MDLIADKVYNREAGSSQVAGLRKAEMRIYQKEFEYTGEAAVKPKTAFTLEVGQEKK